MFDLLDFRLNLLFNHLFNFRINLRFDLNVDLRFALQFDLRFPHRFDLRLKLRLDLRLDVWQWGCIVHSTFTSLKERSILSPTLHKKMKFSIEDFFSKCDQIRSFLQIWLHLLKKSFMENFIFCAVQYNFIRKWNVFALRNSNQSSNSWSSTERNDLRKSMTKKFDWMCWISRGNIAYFFSELTKIGKLIALL